MPKNLCLHTTVCLETISHLLTLTPIPSKELNHHPHPQQPAEVPTVAGLSVRGAQSQTDTMLSYFELSEVTTGPPLDLSSTRETAAREAWHISTFHAKDSNDNEETMKSYEWLDCLAGDSQGFCHQIMLVHMA